MIPMHPAIITAIDTGPVNGRLVTMIPPLTETPLPVNVYDPAMVNNPAGKLANALKSSAFTTHGVWDCR